MNKLKQSYQVVIAGGGPVGLFLAITLSQRGVDCIVLEKRTDCISHSRSLGIHPVSIELMKEIGLADQFLKEGIKIKQGVAWGDRKKIGTLSFDRCPAPYRFVLSLPQYRTEHLLEEKLEQINPDCLVRGAELTELNMSENSVEITVSTKEGSDHFSGKILVGCDGKNSFVRTAAGFSFMGERYPDTYIMGDFSDNTGLNSKAAIFLHREGLIESFPLIDNRRRWVVKTDNFIEAPDRDTLQEKVRQRTGYELSKTENFMLSSFGVQRYIARPMAENRIFLAGDAAHVVSPIGGQGMNLGWLDAWVLSQKIEKTIVGETKFSSPANQYSKERISVAKKAIRRGELNMRLGRKSSFPYLKNSLVWLMLNTPLEHLMAKIFTMRGLDRWPF